MLRVTVGTETVPGGIRATTRDPARDPSNAFTSPGTS